MNINSVQNSHSYPGVDINYDHNLVMMKAAEQLKMSEKCKEQKSGTEETLNKTKTSLKRR